jgi:nucleotide-binding universal stress UspA family protein
VEITMSLRSIIVSVDRSDYSSARIQLAADVANRFDAVLIGIGAHLVDLPAANLDTYATADVYADLMQIATEELGEAHKSFLAASAACNRTEWRGEIGSPLLFLLEHSRAADLIILGRGIHADHPDRQCGVRPGEIALGAGRPILVAPPGLSTVAGKKVAIAWKDTREARRALKDALPFLRDAQDVAIFEVAGTDDPCPGLTDVSHYIEAHGLKVTATRLERGDRSETTAFLAAARAMDADLIVAGAYGHTRLREAVFGGMTRDLIAESHICCLMSH